MKRILLFEEFNKYSSNLGLPKDKWVEIDIKKHSNIVDEFYDLITTAYAAIGGHAKINKPEDIKKQDWSFYEVMDLDSQPDVDLLIFGKKTKWGIKFSGVGHDDSKKAKKTYLNDLANKSKKVGFYAEVSGKLAEIFINKFQVPTVEDEEIVKDIIKKDIKFHGPHPKGKASGNGWYSRKIGGKYHTKIIIGVPQK